MGRTSESFKGQIGRDAGKVVSNFLFGDKHATPYRRVEADKKAEIEDRKMKLQEENVRNQDIYALDAAVINAVDQVISAQIPDNEKDILSLLNELEIQLEVNKWQNVLGEQRAFSKIRNKYPDAVLKKYEQCLAELKYIGTNEDRLKDLNKKISKFRFKRTFSKFLPFWTTTIVIVGIILLYLILRTIYFISR